MAADFDEVNNPNGQAILISDQNYGKVEHFLPVSIVTVSRLFNVVMQTTSQTSDSFLQKNFLCVILFSLY